MHDYLDPTPEDYVVTPSIERPQDQHTETYVTKAGYQFDTFQPHGFVGDGHFHYDPEAENFDPRMALLPFPVDDPFSSSGLPVFNPLTAPNPFRQHFGNLTFEYPELELAATTEQSMARVQAQSAALHNVIEFSSALAMPRAVSIDWEQVYTDTEGFGSPDASVPGASTAFDSFGSNSTLVSREMYTPENDNLTANSTALTFTDEANRFWDLGAPLQGNSPLQSYGFKDGATVNMFSESPVKKPMGLQGRRVFTLFDDEELEDTV